MSRLRDVAKQMREATVATKKDMKKLYPRLASDYLTIVHPEEVWHSNAGYCRLQRSLRHQLITAWNANKVMFTHSDKSGTPLLNVWISHGDCPWRCLSCHEPLYWNRSFCRSCVMQKAWDRKREYASSLPTFKHMSVSNDYEMAYRATKSLPLKTKLVFIHTSCSSSDACHHLSQALRRRGLRDLYCFSEGNITQIIRKK